MDPHSPPSALAPRPGQSILVYGTGTLSKDLWAAGLARRADPGFAWTDLAPPESGVGKDGRLLMSRSSEGAWVNGARPEDAAPPALDVSAIGRLLLAPGAPSDDLDRLREFLRLPSIVQLLAGRATRPDGGATIVILGLDAVAAPLLASTFGSPALHAALRRAGITCITTYRGSPPTALVEPFDLAFRVDGSPGPDWSETIVQATRGEVPPGLRRARLLREQWFALGQPPTLLDLWVTSERVPRRPR